MDLKAFKAQLSAEIRTVESEQRSLVSSESLEQTVTLVSDEHLRRKRELETATANLHNLSKLLPRHNPDKVKQLKHAQKRYERRADAIVRCNKVSEQLQKLKTSLNLKLEQYNQTELDRVNQLELHIKSFEQYFGFSLEIEHACVIVRFGTGTAMINLHDFKYIRFNGREVKIMNEKVTFLQALCLAYSLLHG